MNPKQEISIAINGTTVKASVANNLSLAEFLHEKLGLTGTKVTCAMGICKACTVAARPVGVSSYFRVQACITPVTTLNGQEVLTVEGLAQDGLLVPLQQAFLKHFSFQCGYCAPGFLMGAILFIEQLKTKSIPKADIDRAISESLGEHICRCTGYTKYYEAIKEVALSTPGLTY